MSPQQTNSSELRYICKLQKSKRLDLGLRRKGRFSGDAAESASGLSRSPATSYKTSIMMKKLLLVVALGSLVWLVGCAKGGGGPCAVDCSTITINPNLAKVGIGTSIAFTVTSQNPPNQSVSWSIEPSSCGSACGTLSSPTPSSVTYNAPSSIPSQSFQLVATSQTVNGLSGSLPLTVIPDTTSVGPTSPDVGVGLTQQYVATAAPDQAAQTFTWSCIAPNGPCSNFVQDPQISGLASYTPTAGETCGSSGCVTISAAADINPTGCTIDPKHYPCTISQTTVVASRVPSGIYAFQFSGYDTNGKAIAVAGTFTVAAGGSISGSEDESTWNGSAFVTTQHNFSGGSYTPLGGGNDNSNNAGTLSLNTGTFPSTYTAVLDGSGDIQMTAASGGASGSGFATASSVNKFNQGTPAVFAFGFTGVDASSHRVGYAGLLPTDGVSSVANGFIDVNDNGSASNSVCNSEPCGLAGSYTFNSGTNRGQLTLTAPKAMTFDFFVANGSSSNPNNPLNLYVISTDSNPAVVGTMTLQDSKVSPYNNAAFSGNSISELIGANNNVALLQVTTLGDNGSSGVTGACPGSSLGNLEGTFNQNNAGTLIPPAPLSLTGIGISFPNNKSEGGASNPYTYVSTNGNTGRYVFCLLGDPTDNTPVMPIPFVLYASGANRGYLLDQSSSSVMTGTMNPQSKPKSGSFASAQATGTYAVATNANGIPGGSGCTDLTSCYTSMNLVMSSPVSGTFDFSGIENPGNVAIGGSYTVTIPGLGALTIPGSQNSATNFVIYGVTETNFYMMGWDEESGTNYNGLISPILYMAQ